MFNQTQQSCLATIVHKLVMAPDSCVAMIVAGTSATSFQPRVEVDIGGTTTLISDWH